MGGGAGKRGRREAVAPSACGNETRSRKGNAAPHACATLRVVAAMQNGHGFAYVDHLVALHEAVPVAVNVAVEVHAALHVAAGFCLRARRVLCHGALGQRKQRRSGEDARHQPCPRPHRCCLANATRRRCSADLAAGPGAPRSSDPSVSRGKALAVGRAVLGAPLGLQRSLCAAGTRTGCETRRQSVARRRRANARALAAVASARAPWRRLGKRGPWPRGRAARRSCAARCQRPARRLHPQTASSQAGVDARQQVSLGLGEQPTGPQARTAARKPCGSGPVCSYGALCSTDGRAHEPPACRSVWEKRRMSAPRQQAERSALAATRDMPPY